MAGKCIQTIIWDFNGTLLDDTQVCIDCMNQLLAARALPYLENERYREIFTFPVRDYYLELGFDFAKEPFETPAHQFVDLYREKLGDAPLHEDVKILLNHFRTIGFCQIILSAMEQKLLEETLTSKGIAGYFDRIVGIRDHLGNGKLEMAREILQQDERHKDNFVLVGDTFHDFEVAEALGIRCILVARGHQSYHRLKNLDCKVLKNLKDLVKILC